MYSKNQNNPIVAVGIGPGDPELISLKGLKALRQADVVFYPASVLNEKREHSFSRKIIDAYGLENELRPLRFPMSGRNREQFYREAFKILADERQQGKKVSIVSEGDILFYSTFGYLLEMANEEGVPCELIPGIPAFILGGTVLNEALVSGQQSFGVLPGPQSYVDIYDKLLSTDVLVIMKASMLDNWPEFLRRCDRPFFYAEKLGTSEQFSTRSIEELENREIPYFSIFIFKPKEKSNE